MTHARLAIALAVVLASTTADAGDPTRVHKTLETAHFVIHYFDPLEPVARRVAVVAEASHRTLSPALDHAPSEKTIIVVVDDTDGANGFAGVLPRNAIQLFATSPNSFSELDDHDDWLYGLTAHEYTHILHLDTMSGLPNLYNGIFGKTWAPNQVMPRWVIEGLAVYEESKRSAGGRNRGTRFDQVIRIARHADKDLRLDQVSGAPRIYPRGNGVYIYGSHFLRYVFDRFGDDTVRKMTHTSGGYAPPFAINRQIAKVVGKPFTELYDDWKGYLRDRYGMQELAAERRGLVAGRQLTTSAETNFFPHYSADGKELVWFQSDGYSNAKVRAMPVGGDQRAARDVVQMDAMGPFDLLEDGSLLYEQSRLFRREYSFQDLFRWDARTRQTVRLTHGKRARDPAISADQRRIAYSLNGPEGAQLAVADAVPDATPAIVWKGERFDRAYQPAWSPDGTHLAFSAWRKHGYRDILVLELATGNIEEITRDRAIDMAPRWSPDGKTLYFDSDRTGISNLYAWDLEQRRLWQVTNVLGGAFQAAPSPDGKLLAFQAASPKGGYDLYELPVDRASWLPARAMVDDRPAPSAIRDDSAEVSASRPYRAVETLAPQTWTAQLNQGDTPSLAIQTSGSDAFGLHSYSLAVGLRLDNGEANIGASYGYGRMRFPLRFALSRTLVERGGLRIDGVNRSFREEDWSATFSSNIPFESRPHASWTLSFDYDIDWFRNIDKREIPLDPNMRVPAIPATDYIQSGVGTRLGFSTTRGTTFGVGLQSGFDASLGVRFDHPALGATFRNVTLSYNSNAFRRLWGKTPVLAMRLAGSFRAGDTLRFGAFSLGGVPPQDIAQAIVNSTRAGVMGYLRGFPTRSVTGNQFHLLNLEYRQELWAIERGLATLPVYVRRLHGALLSDTGTAFDTTFDFDRHFRQSVGAALRLDMFFGYFVPGTLEIGYARGLTAGGVGQSWMLLTGTL
ncbi:MAG TPA: DPP IV N-terminal domain-containing protein [Kofleriaceae bacterium]|nr:DPP IV N-terminal domain-containing protein [Kofleriaceae bacterium]